MRSEGSVPSTTWFVLLSAIGGLVLLFDWALDHRELLLVPRPAAPPTNASAVVPGALDERGDGTVGGESRAVVNADARDVASDETGGVADPDTLDAGRTEARDTPDGDRASVVDVSAANEIDALRLLLAEAAVLGATPTRPGERTAWRQRELSILDELSGAIRFAEDSATPDPRTREILAHIADVLALHPDAKTSVAVVGREHADARRDRVLRRERGRAVIAALVEHGLAFSRLSLDVSGEERAASGPHRIRVVVDEPDRRIR